MKVVLPDQSELELPDGATGLDAARAIGPKLAEQAVLVRSNGRVQDLRLPLQDGQPIQILTTRDAADPDALAVLRHSSAHLLALRRDQEHVLAELLPVPRSDPERLVVDQRCAHLEVAPLLVLTSADVLDHVPDHHALRMPERRAR